MLISKQMLCRTRLQVQLLSHVPSRVPDIVEQRVSSNSRLLGKLNSTTHSGSNAYISVNPRTSQARTGLACELDTLRYKLIRTRARRQFPHLIQPFLVPIRAFPVFIMHIYGHIPWILRYPGVLVLTLWPIACSISGFRLLFGPPDSKPPVAIRRMPRIRYLRHSCGAGHRRAFS
jgi:hypothetical protein